MQGTCTEDSTESLEHSCRYPNLSYERSVLIHPCQVRYSLPRDADATRDAGRADDRALPLQSLQMLVHTVGADQPEVLADLMDGGGDALLPKVRLDEFIDLVLAFGKLGLHGAQAVRRRK